jgi:N-acetylneuraminate synthase
MKEFVIDSRPIGPEHPTYFIADIAANHDGSLGRARDLIRLAKEAGADAAKFQHFTASKIVSDVGFSALGKQLSHQASWKKSVSEVYEDASVPSDWTAELKAECDEIGITFFSSPYDFEAVDHLDQFVPAFKVGSGDIDWLEQLAHIARKGKPVILASGASTIGDVQRAVETVLQHNDQIALLQCNTNYTASDANYDHLNLRVLETFAAMWPNVVIGLSDHTHGHAAVLGAVALGARIVERHFTDDNRREGPDHKFALDPNAWSSMVEETRRLERALGTPVKSVALNETDAAVVQRRCIRAARDLEPGEIITRDDLVVLRPATPGAFTPDQIDRVIGLRTRNHLQAGEAISIGHLGS